MTITIERYSLRTYRGVATAYNYKIDGGANCQYGTGLTSLLRMLKRNYPGATIVKTWENANNLA